MPSPFSLGRSISPWLPVESGWTSFNSVWQPYDNLYVGYACNFHSGRLTRMLQQAVMRQQNKHISCYYHYLLSVLHFEFDKILALYKTGHKNINRVRAHLSTTNNKLTKLIRPAYCIRISEKVSTNTTDLTISEHGAKPTVHNHVNSCNTSSIFVTCGA